MQAESRQGLMWKSFGLGQATNNEVAEWIAEELLLRDCLSCRRPKIGTESLVLVFADSLAFNEMEIFLTLNIKV